MEFTRGDTYMFKFQRKNADGEVIELKPDKMFFTVKTNYDTKEILIQKTLENGITYDDEFYYHIKLENADTRDLKYGIYAYDIQVVTSEYVATISKGKLILDKEVTFEY